MSDEIQFKVEEIVKTDAAGLAKILASVAEPKEESNG